MQPTLGGPEGWHFEQLKLRYVCSPPGTRGWRNEALDQARLGEWHDAHAVPKWLEGAWWQPAQRPDDGWLNAQLTPGRRWHDEQPRVLWPEGARWHRWHTVALV